MTDENLDEALDDATVNNIAVDAGVEAIKKIHAIERQMLNRAIHSLSQITGKSVEEVLEILADGINAEYHAEVQKAQAAAKILTTPKKQLYVPKPDLGQNR